MKKQIVFYLLLFILAQFSFSQQKEIDSIENILSTIKNENVRSKKLDSLIKNHYRINNPKIHLYLINKSFAKYNKSKNFKVIGQLNVELGAYHRMQGKIDSCLYYSKKGLEIGKEINDYVLINSAFSAIATVHESKGEYIEAIKIYHKLILSYEKQGKSETRNILITKYNLIGLYGLIGDMENGEKICLELYKHPLIQKDKQFLSEVYLQLSFFKLEKENYSEALNYILEAEKNNANKYLKGIIYDQKGNCYKGIENYSEANKYYQKALKIMTDFGDLDRINGTETNIVNNLIDWKKYQKAEKALLKIKKRIDEKDSHIELKKRVYESLYLVYEAQEKYKKALLYNNQLTIINDSILNKEKIDAIANYEIKYETEKTNREKEKAIQETKIVKLQNQKNRNLFLGLLGVSILLLLTSLFYFGRLKAKKQTELTLLELKETQKRLAIEKQYKDSELKALKAQMNPHFIFNALNSIQEYIVLNQKNLASDYLGKFADLIRNYLHFSDTGFITISDEIHNLNLYLELEKLRFEEQLEYTFSVNEKDNLDNIKIPTMLIQPYVENALKHGLLHKKDNRKLSILISKNSDKTIECIIEDNGIGREAAKKINQKRESQHKSFALKATTERLDLLNYGRDKKIGVEIIDLKNEDEVIGTKVILKIPILNR